MFLRVRTPILNFKTNKSRASEVFVSFGGVAKCGMFRWNCFEKPSLCSRLRSASEKSEYKQCFYFKRSKKGGKSTLQQHPRLTAHCVGLCKAASNIQLWLKFKCTAHRGENFRNLSKLSLGARGALAAESKPFEEATKQSQKLTEVSTKIDILGQKFGLFANDMMNSAFAPLWGLQRQCFRFRNYPLLRLQQGANPPS